jgi:hypothetical protein
MRRTRATSVSHQRRPIDGQLAFATACGEVVNPRRGAADRGECRQAAGAVRSKRLSRLAFRFLRQPCDSREGGPVRGWGATFALALTMTRGNLDHGYVQCTAADLSDIVKLC